MGLFGGGALRKQIALLTEELAASRAEVERVKAEKAAIEKTFAEKDEAARKARDAKRKSGKKLDQIKSARRAAEEKASGLQDKIKHLESELADFRRAMLDSKAEAEKARARGAELESLLDAARRIAGGEKKAAPAPTPAAAPTDAAPTPEAPAPERRRPADPRVERLREQLNAERDEKRALKGKVAEAEKQARIADKKRISAIDRAEATVRELQHHLRAERRAYKILQLQFEAQRERARGAEQAVEARVAAGLAEAAEAPTPAT